MEKIYMLAQKVDSNNTVFKADLIIKAKIPSKRRLNAVADYFKQLSKSLPDREFLISQLSDDYVSLQLIPKNNCLLVDGLCAQSLKKQFKQMTNSEISKFYYNSFKLMTLSEKYHELQNQIKETKTKLEHNLNLAKMFREKVNTIEFATRYEIFSQFNAKKLKALNQELINTQNSFNSFKQRNSKHYPELLDISL